MVTVRRKLTDAEAWWVSQAGKVPMCVIPKTERKRQRLSMMVAFLGLCALPPSPFHAHYLFKKKSLYQKFIIIFICAQLSKAWTEVCSGFIVKILTHIMSMVSF